MNVFLNLAIDDVSFLAVIGALSVLAILFLLLRRPSVRWIVTALIAIVVGVGLALLTCWYVGDVLNAFGAPITPPMRLWIAVAFAGVALAITNLWRSRWWRKVLAVVSIPVLVIAGGAYVNAQIGYYSTVGDALGLNPYHSTSLAYQTGNASADAPVVTHWNPPTSMPKTGRVVSVTIPGTVSHFTGRPAVIYLPPAALVADPPVLPIIMLMSGQPGAPSDWFTAGHIDQYFDTYAAAHHGLAPIVISPDQLSAPTNNPMCVNSSLGNSETYLLVDVVSWIKAHLRVGTARSAWAVGGFSQGATCATQFESGYPKMFGSLLAISSEIMPSNGPTSVQSSFNGSQADYEAAWPANLMKKNAPFTQTVASFAVGGLDGTFRPWAMQLSSAATAAGMDAQLYVSPGTGHDWFTVAYGVKMGMPRILQHMGLAP